MNKKTISPIGDCWETVKKDLFTKEERAILDVKVDLINNIIEERNRQNLSQRDLSELCGVSQPIIARMEKGINDPQLKTILKILYSLGKTLSVNDLPTK